MADIELHHLWKGGHRLGGGEIEAVAAMHLKTRRSGFGRPGAQPLEFGIRIRAALAAGYSVAHLARLYGCSESSIQAIREGRTYKDLPGIRPANDVP